MPRDELPKEPASSEVTPEPVYNSRREFIKNAVLYTGTAAAIGYGLTMLTGRPRPNPGPPQTAFLPPPPGKSESSSTSTESGIGLNNDASVSEAVPKDGELRVVSSSEMAGGEAKTPYDKVSTYNNYYEFGTGKS